MVFSSLMFLCLFLPSALLCYYSVKSDRAKNIILVVFSLFFYAWGEPVYVIALLFSSMVDYGVGLVIDKTRGTYKAKAALGCSLAINLGLLGVFKYSGFFLSNFNFFFGTSFQFGAFSLPLGISFYTFQTMTYSIDMYRGNVKVQRSFLKFLTYVCMFPQLVAGPIVRYSDIENRMNHRKVTPSDFEKGVFRFSQGLFKKVLLANSAGKTAEFFLSGDLSRLSTLGAWIGIIMYAFQIYYDFSGYSDMAIGLGRFFGFEFPENFNYPYISKNATEFWRRWHITLGAFFRDYVYIPLGGNRHHPIRNIMIVWLLTGFWHGASWNFILWGLYYGTIILAEKNLFHKKLLNLPTPCATIYSSAVVLFGWELFYFTDLSRLLPFLKAMLGIGTAFSDTAAVGALCANAYLIVFLILCQTPIFKQLSDKLRQNLPRIFDFAAPVWVVAAMSVSFIVLVGQSYNPFLYFKF